MKSIRFHPEAKAEMMEAAAYYEAQQPQLGRRFLVSVHDALNRLQVNPLLYPVVEGDVRRCLIRTFPFGVLFRIKPSEYVVMAVMHLSRDPGYWRERSQST
jgi:plasmid stabilization system protein ParE